MTELIPFLFFLIVAFDAYTDSNRSVKHRRGIIIYTLACVVLSLILLWLSKVEWYYLASFALLTRLAFFDIVYNLLIGESFTYEGVINKPDKSWVDSIERWTGLSIFWLRIIYLIMYVSFLIFYLLYA